jgi:hypothetical protein
MVEYKKKKLTLQSGGTRNYYYKVSSDGKKKQVSKNEYLKQKGGTNIETKQNYDLLQQLMNVLHRLGNNNNNKSTVVNQIVGLVVKKDLNSFLEFISTILREEKLEDPSVKLILSKLAEEFKKNWSEYIQKFYDEINCLNQNATMKLLERLLNFGIIYREYFFKDKYVRFIIMKLIREIYFRIIIRKQIKMPDDKFEFKGVFDDVLRSSSEWENNPYTDNNISDPANRFAKQLLITCYRNSGAPQKNNFLFG